MVNEGRGPDKSFLEPKVYVVLVITENRLSESIVEELRVGGGEADVILLVDVSLERVMLEGLCHSRGVTELIAFNDGVWPLFNLELLLDHGC